MRRADRLTLARAALERGGERTSGLGSPARAKPRARSKPARTRAGDRNSAGPDRINSSLPADPREVLPVLAAQRGDTLAALSRMLSRGEGYLARFVRKGVPVALTARDHRLLADHLGVSERGLGIRDLWGERARGW